MKRMRKRLAGFTMIGLALGTLSGLSAQKPEIRFLTPENRSRLDPRPVREGFYPCRATIEVSGPISQTVVLEADGLKMSEGANLNKDAPFRADLAWWPWHGNGTYRLKAYAQQLHTREFQSSADIQVEVEGIGRDVINPENHLIKLLREASGYSELFAAPPTRFTSPDPRESRWISTAWIGSAMFRAALYDDGREDVQKWPVNSDPGDPQARNRPLTRPAGTYRILVALIDYGTLEIDRTKALEDLARAADEANRAWAETARRVGRTEPFFKLDVTGVYAKTTLDPNLLIMPLEKVRNLTGVDPRAYDLFAQVDLSAVRPPTLRTSAGGMCFDGYTGRPTIQTNFWILVSSAEGLFGSLRWTLLDHELAHSCGWQHEWPVDLGGGPENTTYDSVWPVLLFGWTDRDGDGRIEILSDHPYGIR